MTDREKMMENESIGKLLLKLSLPATIAMMVQALYNFVDTIFIGRGVGTLGIAAISIGFPIQMVVMAFGQMIGIGGASIISRSLGAKDKDKAELTFGNMVSTGIAMGLIITIFGSLFLDQLLSLFGATETILPYAKDYMQVIIYGSVFFVLGMIFNNTVRAEGAANISMFSLLISAGMNIILDPIFIFTFDMGIRGAALATVISQIIGFSFLLLYYLTNKGILNFNFNPFKWNFKIIIETFAIGSSAFARQVAGSVMAIVLNNLLAVYGGDLSIAIYGVINRLIMFTLMPLFGVAQGYLPISGFNYGAKKFDRVKEVMSLSMIVTSIFSTTGFIILQFFPHFLIGIFSKDLELISQGAPALRIASACIWVVGFQVIGSSLFQAIGKAGPALILSMSRQILIFIPMAFLMSNLFGLLGIWLSFPISDGLSALITLYFVLKENKIMKTKIANDPVYSEK
ncbi:MATE family efflux transporter [Oceanotoga sp. DSM 15011]|uniref:MATE family efflux transporter n=1 Tax=unclassified Oceanotoga TaxID=2618448 RepID=UPI0021F4A620|nr:MULTISPECIES: MATE family efflux transporter [unclassified Oceanotoga]MDN5341425.1 hypothetical protein [Oceanotoga sp.]UYO99107.1 MATE family efflux transporter [Oceanotoga sp. DSM 15011]